VARDYKHSRRKQQKRAQAPGWLWMLFGLAVGLSVAALVYFGDRAPASRQPRPATAAVPSSTQAELQDRESAKEDTNRFDFYEMLPKFEVVIPEKEPDARPDNRPEAIAKPGSYVLQAGSFHNYADADRRKATLALQGIESRIQRVTIDQDTWHRVRIGPYSDLSQVNRLRQQLRDGQIEVLVIRLSD